MQEEQVITFANNQVKDCSLQKQVKRQLLLNSHRLNNT